MEKGDERTDLALVAAVNGGDWGAFDVLYYRHKEWAYRLAWRFSRDETEAADVVQEVFVYLAGKFPGLELRANLTTLLYPAVKHTALALRKKRQRMGQFAEGMEPEVAMPTAEAGATRGELAAAMAGVSEAHREILLMRFVDEMAVEEIATALGIPLGTAKSRLHHAAGALRENPRFRQEFDSSG